MLIAPQIPNNTGAIIRLCANTGSQLHLVKPLGFGLDASSLKRGGLDYHDLAQVVVHEDITACREALCNAPQHLAFTARGSRRFDEVNYQPGAALWFGTEATGLPAPVLDEFSSEDQILLPMRPANRSINLANAVSVVVYEGWRQHQFAGATDPSRAFTERTDGP